MDKFFEDLHKKWLAWKQHNSMAQAVKRGVLKTFYDPQLFGLGLSLADCLRDYVDIPILHTVTEDDVKQMPTGTLAYVYTEKGGHMLKAAGGGNRPWAAKGIDIGIEQYPRTKRIAILACYAAAETRDSDKRLLNSNAFMGFYAGFMARWFLASACCEEIARRIHEFKIKSLFAELKYSKRPDQQAYDYLTATILKTTDSIGIGADAAPDTWEFQNAQEWARDRIAKGLVTLSTQPSEFCEIITLLSMAFSGKRERGRTINLKRKASTRAEEKTIALIVGQADEDERGAIAEGDTVVNFVRSDLTGLSENLSDEQKARVDEKHGEGAGAILELKFRDKTQKEIARELGKGAATVNRRIKSIEGGGKKGLLTLLHPAKRWENLLRDAEREA